MTRKSKRDIERTLEELDPEPSKAYPTVTLAEALREGVKWESVDEEKRLKRREDTGEIYYFPPISDGL